MENKELLLKKIETGNNWDDEHELLECKSRFEDFVGSLETEGKKGLDEPLHLEFFYSGFAGENNFGIKIDKKISESDLKLLLSFIENDNKKIKKTKGE